LLPGKDSNLRPSG